MARPRPTSKLPSAYAKAMILFVVAAVLIAAADLYLTLSRTIITVVPRPQTTTIDLSFTVRPPDDSATEVPDGTIAGRLLSKTKRARDSFNSQGGSTSIPAQATGHLKIINNWTQMQPLAATTRFLSQSGVLFRLKERVDVPAGSSIEAEVYADQAGISGNIGPTTFTLPGLWPGLRDKIYAESTSAMTGGLREIKTVTDEDLRQAESTLRDRLIEEARSELLSEATKENPGLALLDSALTSTITASSSDAEAGDQVDKFTMSITAKVDAVAVDQIALDQAIEKSTLDNLPAYQQIVSAETPDDEITVADINYDTNNAEIRVAKQITTVITVADPLFARANLVNRDRQTLLSYFAGFSTIASADVHLSPFWATRSSGLPDHIEIRLTDPTP